LYLATFYDRELTYQVALDIVRVRMWEKGHSFDKIDAMSLEDMGLVISYWGEQARIERKKKRAASRRKGGRR
jgi:hypothetical protein